VRCVTLDGSEKTDKVGERSARNARSRRKPIYELCTAKNCRLVAPFFHAARVYTPVAAKAGALVAAQSFRTIRLHAIASA